MGADRFQTALTPSLACEYVASRSFSPRIRQAIALTGV